MDQSPIVAITAESEGIEDNKSLRLVKTREAMKSLEFGAHRKLLGAHLASDRVIDISIAKPSSYGASLRPSRLGRSPGFRAIAATSATARSTLNPIRLSRDAGTVADEVVQHLTKLPGAMVEVTLEIRAEIP